MPNIKSAKKRLIVNESNALENKRVRKSYREAVKAFEIGAKNNDKDIQNLYKKAVSELDRAWSKGVLKRNTVDRKKAQLAKLLAK